jgi:hypothetical protein
LEKTEQLVREYEQIGSQISHWDSLSWQTSQFFLAIEGLFLAGIGQLLYSELKEAGSSPPGVALLLLCGVLFNLTICIVWFRINRRNREYLEVRFKRANEIEAEPGIVMRLYTQEREELTQPRYRRHSTKDLEKHIPTIFAIVWVIIGIGTIAILFY